MCGYAFCSDMISCAIIFTGDEDRSLLDVQAWTMLKRLIEIYEGSISSGCISPTQILQNTAPGSLYKLLPDSEELKLVEMEAILDHTPQSIRGVADRVGWVQSQHKSVQSSGTQIILFQKALEEMHKKVRGLEVNLSRAVKSGDTSSRIVEMEANMVATMQLARKHGIYLSVYAEELERLEKALKNGMQSSQDNIKEFDELKRDLNPTRSRLVDRKEVNQFRIRINEMQAELGEITCLVQASDTQLGHITKELKETEEILHKTFEKVLERGGELNTMIKRSESLAVSSRAFHTQVCMSTKIFINAKLEKTLG
jgi:hypothetical protein